MTIANKDFQQAVNRALILREVLNRKEISRAGLARELGMYRSTVSNLIESLLGEGWLIETGPDSSASGAGRKGRNLVINPGKGVVAGISLRKNGSYDITVLDPEGSTLYSGEGRSRKSSFNEITADILEELKRPEINGGLPVLGAGFSLSGIVDAERQIIVNSVKHRLDNLDFQEIVGNAVSYPVLAENDSRCCAWGKAWESRMKSDATFVYLYLNRGNRGVLPELSFGMGVYMDGHVRYGAHKLSGEFSPGYIKKVKKQLGGFAADVAVNPLTLKKQARDRLEELADDFLDMIYILDPHKVYLGTELEPYRTMIEDYIASRSARERFDIEFAGLGPMETAYGAACFILNRLYSVPEAGPGPL